LPEFSTAISTAVENTYPLNSTLSRLLPARLLTDLRISFLRIVFGAKHSTQQRA
jgi:hypothetical protein